jgi:uncharacterized protein (TIGR03083 family)
MEPLPRVDVVALFPELHAELIALLRGLSPADWSRPTAAPAWTVKDVAAHLLDTQLRRLAAQRDGHALAPDAPLASYGDLVAFLDRLNADWVAAARRLSPRLLIDLLALVGPQSCALFAALDPEGEAVFSVAWAGEETSSNWMDLAREYTEWWHHQQQIRDAAGAPPLTARRWLHPVLSTFVRALPRAYRDTPAPAGTAVVLRITGEAGDTWSLVREEAGWELYAGAAAAPAATVTLDDDAAWRLFTKGLRGDAARERVAIDGARALGEPALRALAIMG